MSRRECDAETAKPLAGGRVAGRWWLVAALVLLAAVGLAVWLLPRPGVRPAAPVPAASTKRAAPALAPAQRLARAFAAATGHDRAFDERAGDDTFHHTPLRVVDLPFGPVLLTSRELRDGCHACTGFLGIYYLKPGEETAIAAAFPEAVRGWGFGAAPEDWSLTNRFTAHPAIYASGGYSGQGVTVASATITELTPDGPRESQPIGIGYTDADAIVAGDGRRPCVVTGTVLNVVRDRSFDVGLSGSIERRVRYLKRDGRFVAAAGDPLDPPCPW